MRLKAIVAALMLGVAAPMMGGCATTNPPNTNPDIAAIIAQVQSVCAQICKFVPTAGTIVAIVTGNNPGVISATAIAQAICAAIAAAPPVTDMARRKGTIVVINGWRVKRVYRGDTVVATVNGVVIHGRFIQ